jgi:mycothiol synthase
MKLTIRPYQTDADYWRIRRFLREVFALNQRRQVCWPLVRWDYWTGLGVNVFEVDWCRMQECVFIWETEDGQLAAMMNPEGRGDVFLQVHPAFKTRELETEMLSLAETCLGEPQADGKRSLCVWAIETDGQRQALLQSRGYTKGDGPEYMRSRPMSLPIPDRALPEGYSIRAVRWPEDAYARSLAGWKAFHPVDVPPSERYASGEWYNFHQGIPIYRSDLDLLVIAPDGEIAAFTTVWFDDVTRTGVFEPVGTVPAYQRKGLGKAVMYEGLRLLKARGADLALVSSYSEAAGALYASVGFTEYELLEPWIKTI